MQDSIGGRMKDRYEDRFRFMLSRRTYTIIRIDGKAFHSFTRHCEKPYDLRLRCAMVETAVHLCNEIQGSNFAYCQSDEISILVTDFSKKDTNAWFDNNLQKMCSVSASIATAYFNRIYGNGEDALATFDSRVFQIPDRVEVENYFIWRQKDAERNSISMLAQHHFSHKQLHGKSVSDMHEMLHTKGVNWNDVDCHDKRGSVVWKDAYTSVVHDGWKIKSDGWHDMNETPIFAKQRDIFQKLIQERGY